MAWDVVYSEDFSTDPVWVTNTPARYYWNSTDETYSATQVNINSGGGYGYYFEADWAWGSSGFRLEWDQRMSSCDYASGLYFGLYDTDLHAAGQGSFAWIGFTNPDQGHIIQLFSGNEYDELHTDWTGEQYSFGVWYHVVMVYAPDTNTLTADVTVRDTGAHFVSLEITGAGSFAADMCRVGSSNVREGGYQVPGAQASGEFDNVVAYVLTLSAADARTWGAIKAMFR
jgi:hypothetical protein